MMLTSSTSSSSSGYDDDVWTLVLQQMECTQSLLKLRLVNKFLRSMLPMDFIAGISMSTARILWNPETTRHDRIQIINQSEDVEEAIVNGGNELWSWVYSNPIRLTQYAALPISGGVITKRVTSFITTDRSSSRSDESFLWIKITDNGLICTLSSMVAPGGGGTVSTKLSVMRRKQQQLLLLPLLQQEEDHREEEEKLLESSSSSSSSSTSSMMIITTITVKDINPKQILRHSVFDDEPVEYTFSRKSLQCFTWNGRSFIMMLPLDKKDEVWIMEIGKEEKCEEQEEAQQKQKSSSSAAQQTTTMWVISSISNSSSSSSSSLRIGCVRQVRNLLYVIPEQAGSVFVMDLCDDRPRLTFHSILPELPAGGGGGTSSSYCTTTTTTTTGSSKKKKIRLTPLASLMDVSENGENFVVQDARAKQLFHLTKTSVRSLDDRRQFNLNGFSLVGNHAVVCFFRDSRQYSLYNLKTKAHVRTFNFEFQPLLSLMGKDCIWSIGPTMSVYRQIAAAAAAQEEDTKDSSFFSSS